MLNSIRLTICINTVALILAALLLATPLQAETPGDASIATPNERPPIILTERARQIHERGILIDGHNDLPWQIRAHASGSFDNMDISVSQKSLHTDIPRLEKGGLDAQFWVVYIPADTPQDGTAKKHALEQFDLIDRMIKRYPDTFERAVSTDDIIRIHKNGKIASMIGVEGGHMIENSLDTLRLYYKLGARYMGLTHSDSIDWADSATDDSKAGGLSEFGKTVVLEMNRLGMLVDLAHVSARTMRDVLAVSKAPVIFSHSSAFAIAEHARNVPDDVLAMVKKNNGVVMVNFYSGYVHPQGAKMMTTAFDAYREMKAKIPDEHDFETAWEKWESAHPIPDGTVHTLVDHIDHIVKIAGVDHVGIGSDYDGVGQLPKQLEDVSCFPYITQELVNRGYTETDIHKVLGGNLLRVFKDTEAVAARMQKKDATD